MNMNLKASSKRIPLFATVFLALVVVQLGIGAHGVLYVMLVKDMEPLIFCLYRDCFSIPVLFLASYVAEKRIMIPKSRDLFTIALLGFVGMFLIQLASILGVIYTTPDTAAMFKQLVPVACSVIALVFRIERIPRLNTKTGFAKVFGILLASGGALVMTYGKSSKQPGGNSNAGKSTLFGYIALVVNVVCSSLFIVIQKKYIFSNPASIWRFHPIGTTAWAYLFGSVWTAFASLYYVKEPQKFHVKDINVVYGLIYTVIVISGLCVMLISWANMLVNSTFVTATWPLQPLFCVVISYIVLGETVVILEAVGGLLIVIALFAIVWSNYKEETISKREHTNILSSVNKCHDDDDAEGLLDE